MGARLEALKAQGRDTHAHLATDPQAGLRALAYLRFLAVEEARVSQARQSLQPKIAAQKATTAQAVGRHDVLQKLAKGR
ncbi:hypothetical protein [Thioclava pacifica]|nr:hypothetical protein [Thioclava pacifica]